MNVAVYSIKDKVIDTRHDLDCKSVKMAGFPGINTSVFCALKSSVTSCLPDGRRSRMRAELTV